MGSAKENWGKLTDDDLEQISGKREQLRARSRKPTESLDERPKSKYGTGVRAWSGSRRKLRKYSALPGIKPYVP